MENVTSKSHTFFVMRRVVFVDGVVRLTRRGASRLRPLLIRVEVRIAANGLPGKERVCENVARPVEGIVVAMRSAEEGDDDVRVGAARLLEGELRNVAPDAQGSLQLGPQNARIDIARPVLHAVRADASTPRTNAIKRQRGMKRGR